MRPEAPAETDESDTDTHPVEHAGYGGHVGEPVEDSIG